MALQKYLPILVLVTFGILGALTLRDYITFEQLARHQEQLNAFRQQHMLLASFAFIGIYTVIVALSLPGAVIATLAGGFLFGLFPGVIYNAVAATVGASAVFMAAKVGFGADIAARMSTRGGPTAKLQKALRENEWSALFIMRLVPAVPFFIANLLPAFVGTSLRRFLITTFFGILPGSFVFTSIGAGLSDVFSKGQTPDVSVIFSLHILGPLLGLAFLAALPILIKVARK